MSLVTLVRVPSLFAGSAVTLSDTPPIGLAYLASAVRDAGYDTKVIDSVGEAIEQIYSLEKNLFINGYSINQIINNIPKNSKYIGLSLAFSHEWPFAKKIIKKIKQNFPHAIIICGGEHASAMPEHCMTECLEIDYCVLGEGENTLVNLLKYLDSNKEIDFIGIAYRDKNCKIIKTEYSINKERIRDINKILTPAWDLIPLENYLSGGHSFGVNLGRSMPIMASRGCPYQCTFCSNPQMWGTKWTSRLPINVINEMEKYIKEYNIDNFDFYDLTVIVKKSWIVEFCNLLIEKKLNITWQLPSGTRTEALDGNVTKLLYQSGCKNLSFSPESGSKKTLKIIKKKIIPKRMLKTMKESLSNKINIKANIIIGFPSENIFDILATYLFIVRMAIVGVHDVAVWTFSAYPGSEIFDELMKKEKKINFDDQYYYNLLSYSDLKNVISWNERFSNTQLKYLRLFGFVIFYGINFIIRPNRLISLILNVYKRKPVSRSEMILEKVIFRNNKNLATKIN